MVLPFILLLSCQRTVPLQDGDLLFVKSAASPMSEAIVAATAREGDDFDHVAIFYCRDAERRVIESIPKMGVVTRSLAEFLSENGKEAVVAMRVSGPLNRERVISKALSYLGQPYDFPYLPDNGKIYCSELVWLCYTDDSGRPLFSSRPMNFRTPDGSLPLYWTALFDSLGMAVPEGIPGTNPNDMAREPLLVRLEHTDL